MKVLVVGGGSGGHVTPALAVVREIIEQRPRTRIEFWTDRKYYRNVVKTTTEIGLQWGKKDRLRGRKAPYIRVKKITAGKFNRYAGWHGKDYIQNWQITLRDLIGRNFLGFFRFMLGLGQSFVRLTGKKQRPDVIFLKGGFVGLPVGLVAGWLKIPYVIHESDVTPGLANRILMRKAKVMATGFDLETLSGGHPQSRRGRSDEPRDDGREERPPEGVAKSNPDIITVGIPIAPEYKTVSESRQKALKRALGFDPEKPLVMITGGSQGSENINLAVQETLAEMLKFTSVGLVSGREHSHEVMELKKYEQWEDGKLISNFRLWIFSTVMHELMGAADIVVSRAGATTVAEIAALKKATILVPFEPLAGAHQAKNAQALAEAQAAVVVSDLKMQQDSGLLLSAVRRLMHSPKKRQTLAENLHQTARPQAARELATIILEVAEREQGSR